jgi:hypothetical protein
MFVPAAQHAMAASNQRPGTASARYFVMTSRASVGRGCPRVVSQRSLVHAVALSSNSRKGNAKSTQPPRLTVRAPRRNLFVARVDCHIFDRNGVIQDLPQLGGSFPETRRL